MSCLCRLLVLGRRVAVGVLITAAIPVECVLGSQRYHDSDCKGQEGISVVGDSIILPRKHGAADRYKYQGGYKPVSTR